MFHSATILTHKKMGFLSLALSSLLIVGCSKPASETVADSTADTATDTNTVTVYSARNEQLIKPLLDEFTKDTGIKINLVTDKAAPLMARLQAEGKNSPADMFITVDAGNLWQAAQQGIFQPVTSETISQQIPAHLRDPDNQWYGLSIRARTIFYDPRTVNPDNLSTYEDLADPKWQGKLCLRTSKKVYNQSLVAMMIAHHGMEKTENIVKGWVSNLATPVFSDDTKLLEAIAAGQCQVGIANSYYYGRILAEDANFPVKLFWANQQTHGTHVNISGAGVTKYAPNPLKAVQLIEWLSAPKAQAVYASEDKEYPVNVNVESSALLKSWGEFKQDQINVAQAGQLQSEAIQLMDRVGYK